MLPILCKYVGVDGVSHEASITPLVRAEGFRVFHTMIGWFQSADESAASNPLALFATIDPDEFWKVARMLFKGSVIDLKQCPDLDSFDGFNGSRIADLYSAVMAAFEVNFPDFFRAKQDSTGSI